MSGVRLAAVSMLVPLAAVTGGAPDGVRTVAPLAVPRAAHTATLLRDGRVLVAGGCTVDGCELDERGESTELYEPARRRFVPGPPLRGPRVGHAAIRLLNGSVLIAGGWKGDDLTTEAVLLDSRARAFRDTGRLHEARGGYTATRLRDGRVLFAGGASGGRTLRSAELYDPASRTFVRTGSLRAARAAHAASLLPDGRVLVVGGSRDGRVLPGAEIYDPRTGRFSWTASLRTARHKHGAVAVRGGVLVVGGSDASDFGGRHSTAELYDADRRRFVSVSRMTEPRFKIPDAVVSFGGAALVAGGGTTVEVYDVRRRRFRAAGRLGDTLSFATATRLRDGSVLVVGGYDDAIAVSRRAWLYRR